MSAAARPRPELRTSSSWWLHHDDGTVSLVILRRTDRASGGWLELEYRAATKDDAEEAYELDGLELAEKQVAKAARRARWGPNELKGKA